MTKRTLVVSTGALYVGANYAVKKFETSQHPPFPSRSNTSRWRPANVKILGHGVGALDAAHQRASTARQKLAVTRELLLNFAQIEFSQTNLTYS